MGRYCGGLIAFVMFALGWLRLLIGSLPPTAFKRTPPPCPHPTRARCDEDHVFSSADLTYVELCYVHRAHTAYLSHFVRDPSNS